MKSKMMWICLSVFFFVLSGNSLSGASVAKDVNDITPSAPASLNDLPEDALIARVLEQKIYLKDINPSQSQMEKYAGDKTPEQLEQWKRQHRRSNFSHYFWTLFEQYAQEKNIEVTEQDVEQFNTSMLRSMTSQAEKAQKKVNSLQKELQADNLDDAKRSELTNRQALYNSIITRMAESEGHFKSRNTPAERMILIWKLYNRLYEQYGGRVIFQQAGPEPLDAYRKFFEDEQKKGRFEFFNKEAEALFWEYYRNEKIHTFYSDEAEAKKMMETPWWLKEPDQTQYPEDMDVWGDCTDGLCIKINPKKRAFTTEEDVAVAIDLLNIGEQTFICSPCQQFFEIEVDGKWYDWNGPKVFDQMGFPLKPKSVNYIFFEIELSEQWLSLEIRKPLKLAEGTHYLRFRYQPMGTRSEDGFQEITPTFWVTSNLQTFKIMPFEQPLTIKVEGQPEITRKVGKWLAKNPRAVKSVLGQTYRVTMPSLRPRPDNEITASSDDAAVNFKIKIMDASGNRMVPELEEKLTELIRKQMQE
ncbi:MAG: hypothetical protein ISS71_01515 [Phycisphaerae bacterium]|nr:hypothetical protein [Phycisphaerae bacterium]